MDYITVKEAAQKWGVTTRHIQNLCNQKKIKGAYRFGKSWMIPVRAILPSSVKKHEDPHLPMPRQCPFLDMTDLYNKVGGADECAEMLVNNPEAYALFKAQIAYRRGDIAQVYKHARYFLDSRSGFNAILGGSMLLSSCGIWAGDVDVWNEAKRHVFEAPCHTDQDREIVSLALAIIDSSIYDNKNFPDWFKRGNFEKLPFDSLPAAKVFYIKYIYMTAFGLAAGQLSVDGMQGLSLMKMLPNLIEPMISQAVADQTIIPEIYLRLSCAVAYHNSGERELAIYHIDKALSSGLPDNLYGIFAEYVRHFSGLLEERIALIDEEAFQRVEELSSIYTRSWSRISGKIRNRVIAYNLTAKEYEVAKLIAFGFSSKEIANMLYISESTVKQTVARIINKTGIQDKNEIHLIL